MSQITQLKEIIDQIDFKDLDEQVKKSEIFEKIAIEIYNWWPWSTWIGRINEKIIFFIEVLPIYSKIYWKNFVETLEILANARNCNYTNWFQNANIRKDFWDVLVFKNADEFFAKYPEKKYICPKCWWHSTSAYECNAWCDWKVYWLFWDLWKWTYLFFTDKIKENPIPQNIFKPINL